MLENEEIFASIIVMCFKNEELLENIVCLVLNQLFKSYELL